MSQLTKEEVSGTASSGCDKRNCHVLVGKYGNGMILIELYYR
jgi:hypothetical protein